MRISPDPSSACLKRRRIAAPVAALLLTAVAAPSVTTLLVTPAAQAHSTVVASSPGQNSTVQTPPKDVSITFNEDISPEFVRLTVMKDGSDRAKGEPKVEVAKMSVEVGELDPAKYTVGYRVVSADGHPIQGSYEFTIAGSESSSSNAGSAPGAGSSTAQNGQAGAETSAGEKPGGETSNAQTGETAEKTDSSSPWLAFVIFGAIALVLIGGLYFFARQYKRLQESSDSDENYG